MRVWASVILLGVSGAVAAPASLTSSTPATGTLAPGDVATYAVKAQSGNRLRLMVRQRRVDVAVRVIAPSGAVLGSVTNASHRTDPVTLTVITAESGAHRVEIQLEKPDSHPGAFRLSLDPVAPASDRDRQRMYSGLHCPPSAPANASRPPALHPSRSGRPGRPSTRSGPRRGGGPRRAGRDRARTAAAPGRRGQGP